MFSHAANVIRPAAAFRRAPINILRWVLDVAGFAMHAILRIDHQARLAFFHAHRLINPSGAIAAFGAGECFEIHALPARRIAQLQMRGLVFLMIGIRQKLFSGNHLFHQVYNNFQRLQSLLALYSVDSLQHFQ